MWGLQGALAPRGAALQLLGRAGGAEPGAAVVIAGAGASCRCPPEHSALAGLIVGINNEYGMGRGTREAEAKKKS